MRMERTIFSSFLQGCSYPPTTTTFNPKPSLTVLNPTIWHHLLILKQSHGDIIRLLFHFRVALLIRSFVLLPVAYQKCPVVICIFTCLTILSHITPPHTFTGSTSPHGWLAAWVAFCLDQTSSLHSGPGFFTRFPPTHSPPNISRWLNAHLPRSHNLSVNVNHTHTHTRAQWISVCAPWDTRVQ